VVHATASVEDLESGHLPSVCAKTGLRADGFATIRVGNTPGWTWILLFFGVFPFLIAVYFATRRIDALIPMSDLALRRLRAFTRIYLIFFALAAVLLGIGLFAEHPTVAWIGFLTALLTLLFIAFGWLFVYPTGRFLDQDRISLSFVDKRFATALDRWYGESRVSASVQPGGAAGGKSVNWKRTTVLLVVVAAILFYLSMVFCSQNTDSASATDRLPTTPKPSTSWVIHPGGLMTWRTTALTGICTKYPNGSEGHR